MVHLTHGSQAASSDLIFAKTAVDSQATASSASSSASSTDSFANQLATAIEGYLSKSGNGSQFEINVQNGTGTNGGFTITVTNPSTTGSTAATTTATPASSGATASSSYSTSMGLFNGNATVASPSPTAEAVTGTTTSGTTTSGTTTSGTTGTGSTAGGTTLTAAQLAQMTPDQAYWAEQPAAVQALQNMDPADRAAAAQALAEQGYTIDVPIMVWGQDPLTTMVMRQQDGYTWVPSAMQANVQLPPGVSMPGLTDYDPSNPPAGSIQVTTAFANGTNGQDPWMQWPSTSSSNS